MYKPNIKRNMGIVRNYDYGIIGNCTSAALISSDCSIDWLCLPYFDSPSLFARILDSGKGGFFKITADNILDIQQSYIRHTAILLTRFRTAEGVFEVRDYMPRFMTQRNEHYCPSELQRSIRITDGDPIIRVELSARPNYATTDTEYIWNEEYLKIVTKHGDYNSYYIYTDIDTDYIKTGKPFHINKSAYILLSYHEKIRPVDPDRIYTEYERTKSYWLAWCARTILPDMHRDMALRSAITLKLLSYNKTGAVIAAPTTSLPEIIGKDRNWDYRYSWVRDASMIIELYARMGHANLAKHFLDFILNRMLLKKENISVMYGIHGEKDIKEVILDHLEGYENSKPVRIGNSAFTQTQNDLYGELLSAIFNYFTSNHGQEMHHDQELWTVVRAMVNNVINIWQKPDDGIWEFRDCPRHYVHSKLMSWVAMNKASKIATMLNKGKYARKCLSIAEEIKKDIIEHGWNPQIEAFSMYYGSDNLDAANLLMLHYGFLPPSDKMMTSTVRQSYDRLVKNNYCMRYTQPDSFGKPTSAFIICTFWMINALYLTGEKDKANEMFSNILSKANHLGLMSEAIDTVTGRLTGNFPQGYSHLALLQTIFLIGTEYNWLSDSAIMRPAILPL